MKQEFFARRAARYQEMGYRVFGCLPGLRAAPKGWRGPAPDLLVEKGRRRIAKLFWDEEELTGPEALPNLQAILENPGVTVRLFAFSEETLRAANILRGRTSRWSQRLRVEVFYVRSREGGEGWRLSGISRLRRLEWAVGISAVLVGGLLIAVFYFVPSFFSWFLDLGFEAGIRAREEDPSRRIGEIERRLERERGVSRGAGGDQRPAPRAPGGQAPGAGDPLEQEIRRRYREEEIRRRAETPVEAEEARRERQRLKELEERALEEMRRRGITVDDLKKRGIDVDDLRKRGIFP